MDDSTDLRSSQIQPLINTNYTCANCAYWDYTNIKDNYSRCDSVGMYEDTNHGDFPKITHKEFGCIYYMVKEAR